MENTVESATIALVHAIESAWASIRKRHPEVPPVIVTIGSGSEGQKEGTLKNGHFASSRWLATTGEGPGVSELFVAGEGLARGGAEVFETLLHEAAHGLADARDVEDTSRQGRYHNKQFVKHANELGLSADKWPNDAVAALRATGYSKTALLDATAKRYAKEIAAISAAITIVRRPETRGGSRKKNKSSNNGVVWQCEGFCGRKIRMSKSAADLGDIACEPCRAYFRPVDTDEESGE